MKITDTAFWNELMHDVYGPRSGDAIVLVDAEDSRKGVGKTSCALALAQLCAKAFDYEIKENDVVLSGDRYLQRLKNHPGEDQPSVVVWDEAVGAGSGDSRRAMANQNVIMGRAWQTMRTKRTLSFVTLPDWNLLDSRLQKLADYRVWCLNNPIGFFKPYEIGTQFSGPEIRLRGLPEDFDGSRKIKFPNLDAHDDELYRILEDKKRTLLNSENFDADEALATDGGEDGDIEKPPDEIRAEGERQQAVKTALRAVKPWADDEGMSQKDAADLVDYSESWVGNRVREYRNGEHQEVNDNA